MAKAVLLAWSSPQSADRIAEFHNWYENTHIPQIRAAVPAITEVSRYEFVDSADREATHRYLAIYELDDADVEAAAAALAENGAAGRIEMTTAMDLTDRPPVAQWYRGHTA